MTVGKNSSIALIVGVGSGRKVPVADGGVGVSVGSVGATSGVDDGLDGGEVIKISGD
jgi:hypothetical protein